MLARADGLALVLSQAVWPDALAEGLVVGEPDGQANYQQRALSRDVVDPLLAELTSSQIQAMVRAVGELNQAVLEEFRRVSERAVRLRWDEETYVAAILAAARRAGLEGFLGSWAATWYSNLLAATYSAGILSRFRRQPTSRLFPYLMYVTARDDRVRHNHRQIDGFVASPVWRGWPSIMPPNGHNCRCLIRPVTWQQARALGLVGTLPPASAAMLAGWDGPDDGWGGLGVGAA